MALAFLEKTPALYASMRPQWLRNLEIDMGLKKEIPQALNLRFYLVHFCWRDTSTYLSYYWINFHT